MPPMFKGLSGEEELLRSRAFYRAAFEVNTAIKLIIDPTTGELVDANPAAAEFYGYPIERLRGMNLRAINTAPESQVREAMKACVERRRSHFEFQHRIASGEIRDVEIYSGPLELPGRKLLLSIIHDITDRKRLEAQLLQAQKMEAFGQMAGGVAHDFNNLLTAIFGYGELLIQQTEPGSPARESAQHVLRVLRRAEELTRQLLTFSRKRLLRSQRVDLNSVVRSTEDLLRRLLGERVRLETELAVPLPVVLADPGQLELAIMNLAVNSRDAMPQGGKVTICTRREPSSEVALSVADTGSGMDAATQRRLFEPFFTTKPPNQGTGLGLPTVYSFVQQCGGTIHVASQPGRGTVFTLRFPAVEGAPEGP